MTAANYPPSAPTVPGGLPDPDVLARLAREFFDGWPGASAGAAPLLAPEAPIGVLPTALTPGGATPSGLLPSGVLPPGSQPTPDLAPPGSPLASPAGFGPSVPGTPIPQGLAPGLNLLPGAPDRLAPLAHRLPARLPHAVAGNDLPDNVVTEAPAYLPRLGGAALGVPRGVAPIERPTPGGATGAGAVAGDPGGDAALDRLAREAWAWQEPPVLDRRDLALADRAAPDADGFAGATGATPGGVGGVPSFYFLPAADPRAGLADVDAPSVPTGGRPAAPGAGRSGATASGPAFDAHPAFDVQAIRRDFPILAERVNGRPLVWFDNAATTQKPRAVIDRLDYFYTHENSNIHRAAHELAARATDAYEQARERVRDFLHAPEVDEIIFVRGTTEAINLVAKTWGVSHVGEGDEIIVSHLEHHANIVPWQQLAAQVGARLRVIPVDNDGQVLLDEYRKLLNDRTKIVAVTQVSNALGTVVPVAEIVEAARRAGVTTLIDGAQSVSHMPVDVQALGADFFVFSGHKIFGPTGIGVLFGRREVLEDMPPWQGGGNMIADVTFEKTVYQPIPTLFEAGTGNIADAVGLGAALDYVQRLGLANIARYEHDLLDYATGCLAEVSGVTLIGTAPDKASVLSFVLDGYSPEEVGRALNRDGIAVRAGHHCAQPILRRFGLEATVRPSLAFYNTRDEVDHFIRAVDRLARARR